MRIRRRSTIFALRLRSLKMITPQAKDMRTEPRRISDTTEIIESSMLRALKYEKSAAPTKTAISGIAQLQWNLVVFSRVGYYTTIRMMNIMMN